MKYNPEKHHRRSIRLSGYNYCQPGYYFITTIVQERACCLGKIRDGQMTLNLWRNSKKCLAAVALTQVPVVDLSESPARLKPDSLGSIIGQFKSVATKKICKSGILHFKWQRNYYEHIIRNKRELDHIRNYIKCNPLNWQEDRFFYSPFVMFRRPFHRPSRYSDAFY